MGLLDDAIREHLDLKRRRGADPTEIERLEREALGPVRRGPHETPELVMDDEGAPPIAYPAPEEAAEWAELSDEPAQFDHGSAPPPSEAWAEPPATDELDLEAGAGPGVESSSAPGRSSELPRHHEIAEEWEAHERQAPPAPPGGLEPDELAPAPPPPARGSSTDEPSSPPPAAPAAPAPTPGGPAFGAEPEESAPTSPADFEQETVEYEVESGEERAAGEAEAPEGDEMLEETPEFLQDTPEHDRLWFEQRPPRDFDFDG
jgi:hypothetical protein